MRHVGHTGFILSLFLALPATLSAATIVNYTDAAANSGGNTVGSGGTVTTGAQSASVQVTNQVNGSDGGSSSETTVTTENNGISRTETYDGQAGPGEPLTINIATSSPGADGQGGVNISVHEEIHGNSSAKLSTSGTHSYSPRTLMRELLPPQASTSLDATTSGDASHGSESSDVATGISFGNGLHFGSLLSSFFGRILSFIGFWK